MNTYKIVYQPYDRFESPAPRIEHFKAPNNKLALLKADPNLGYGCGKFPKELDEDELKDILAQSVEKFTENLRMCNGDGTDFLFLLENETTGKVIFRDGDYMDDDEVEEWDEDFNYEEEEN